jgi:uncharacterized delta-60 repeat protein
MKYFLFFILLLFRITGLIAQAGSLDSTFGVNGITFFPDGGANSIAVQNDNKIVVAGGFGDHFGVVRFNNNGSIDSTFGTNGAVETEVGIGYNVDEKMILQSDGKIVVGGTCLNSSGEYVFALVRYDESGQLDNSFGTNGVVLTSNGDSNYGEGLAIQPDGKIIQVGRGFTFPNNQYFAIARFNSDGSLDNSFGFGGTLLTTIGNVYPTATCVAVQPDDKIVVGGYSVSETFISSFCLIRYNSDGSLDESFGTSGKDTTYFGVPDDGYDYDVARAIALQSDGKILLTGHSVLAPDFYGKLPIVRYNADGTLDNTFGIGGKLISDVFGIGGEAHAIALQPDGKILVTGLANGILSDFILARYDIDGTLDSTFGSNGTVINSVGDDDVDRGNAVTLDKEEKIIIAGGSNLGFTVIRYLSGLTVGISDVASKNNSSVYPNPCSTEIHLCLPLLQPAIISIFNLLGEKVKEEKVTGRQVTMDVSSLPQGLYLVRMENGVVGKFVKE